MKEVVLDESLTNKTVSRSRLSFDGKSLVGLVPGSAMVMPGLIATIADSANIFMGITCFTAGAMFWLVGSTNSGVTGEIYKFHRELYKVKDLKAQIPSGTRMKIGKSKYNTRKEIDPDSFSNNPSYEKYEIELFVRNTKGKLTVEYEISEIPAYTWKNAFESILVNDNINKDALSLSYQHEFQDELDKEAAEVKKSYKENSKGFLASLPAL